MIRRLVGMLFVTVLLLGGCGGEQAAPDATPLPVDSNTTTEVEVSNAALIGTSWELEAIGEPGDDLKALPTVRSTLNYLGERYIGYGGCNFFLGVYSAEGQALIMYSPAMSEVVCEDTAVANQEDTFMSALLNTIEYEIVDGKLLGYTDENQRLLTMVPAEPVPLQGTVWELKLTQNGDEWFPVVPDSQVTLVAEDDKISGSGGCNEYSATIVRSGDTVSIEDLTATEQSCPEPVGLMDQENAYFASLQSAVGYIELAGAIALIDAEGNPTLIFGVE